MRLKIAAAYLGLLLGVIFFVNHPSPLVDIAHAQSVSSRAEDAVQLIRNYYRWINQKKYQGAFNIWEKREDGSAASPNCHRRIYSGEPSCKKFTV